VQHGSRDPIASRPVFANKLQANRTAKSLTNYGQ
jgi:hypothetical protein